MNNPKEIFYQLLKDLNFPEWVEEHRFNEDRMFRFDLAWPEVKVALEIEGATWRGGRHTTGAGFKRDKEKYNSALVRGWLVLQATTDMLKDSEFLVDLFDVLALRGAIIDCENDGTYQGFKRDCYPDLPITKFGLLDGFEKIEMEREAQKCPYCKGSGEVFNIKDGRPIHKCDNCRGTGKIPRKGFL